MEGREPLHVAVERALLVAERAHAGQLRTGLDEPYIMHPRAVVALAVEVGLSVDAQVAAALHDVLEDTSMTLADLEARSWGEAPAFSKRALHLVRLLTKWWRDDTPPALKAIYKRAYYEAIATDAEAIALKKLDRTHNLRDMIRVASTKRSWARAYHAKTVREFQLLPSSGRVVEALFLSAVFDLSAALDLTSSPPVVSS